VGDDEVLRDLNSAVFGPDPSAVGPARAFVRETVRGWGADAVADDAVLIASELVTNVIVHAGTPAEVCCALLRDPVGAACAVRVEVADRHPKRTLPALTYEAGGNAEAAECGRGLYLSAQLASAWGVQYTRAVKQVWFVLNLPQTAPTAPRNPEPLPWSRLRGKPFPSAREAVEDFDDYLTLAAEQIKALLDADGAFVMLTEDGDLEAGLRMRAQAGLPAGIPRVTAAPSVAGRIDLSVLPAVYPDLAGPSDHGSPLIGALADAGLRSMVTAPLAGLGISGPYGAAGLVGVVARAPDRFTEADALRLGEGADRIAASPSPRSSSSPAWPAGAPCTGRTRPDARSSPWSGTPTRSCTTPSKQPCAPPARPPPNSPPPTGRSCRRRLTRSAPASFWSCR
jgi:anti-sigma regulatory factor (Ser/Thr protein kinase)